MSGAERIRAGLLSLARAAEATTALAPDVAALAARYVAVLSDGGTLYFAGNGGSAADAQHFTAELVGRFGHQVERRAWPVIAPSMFWTCFMRA